MIPWMVWHRNTKCDSKKLSHGVLHCITLISRKNLWWSHIFWYLVQVLFCDLQKNPKGSKMKSLITPFTVLLLIYSVTVLYLCDRDLTGAFLDTMQKTGADFTNCFRCLSRLPFPGSLDFEDKLQEVIKYILSQCCTVEELKKEYKPRMNPRYM
jgi:hypothetical protein